ncbi:unnamed protein product [Didymodactylos carnosus]|uniref:NAD(P)(+)--arginine ADP-ribosyltransferase n=1 Tax=Didymodactylos carnosus TaxID=1234261 RepID=A0A8S2EKW2_9BILA|nr:unnamed protein product [Didymodactylos carnosus]CAF3983225.1 unnamed protein product [Didymodactylos carnosus]
MGDVGLFISADGSGSIPKLFANFAQCDIMLNEITGVRKAMLNPINRPADNEQVDKDQQSRFNKKLSQKEQSDNTVAKEDVLTKKNDSSKFNYWSREDKIIKGLAEYSGKNIENKKLLVVTPASVQQNILPASNETNVRYCDIQLSQKKLPAVYGYLNSPLLPLEAATDPILHLVDNLNRYVKIAKQHCTTSVDASLTHDESAAIYLYTMEMGDGSFYRILNKALRSEDRPALKPWFYYLKLLDYALNKLKSQNIVAWRGMHTDASKSFKKDDEIVWWSINSCSSSVDIVKNFLGTNSTLFLIECTNGKDISSDTAYPNENEVILMPGTCLKVVSDPLDHEGGLHIVHLRETETI